jgi:hypothetical protein
MTAPESPPSPADALEALAGHLSARNVSCTLAPSRPDGEPVLEASNRRRWNACERIRCTSGWYWWESAERIAPVTDPPGAADVIAQALCVPLAGKGR